jgi:hypothetical protein
MSVVELYACQRKSASLSKSQCEQQAARGFGFCEGCPGVADLAQVSLVLTFAGDDLETYRQFAAACAVDGSSMADNVLAVMHLAVTGPLFRGKRG